MTPDLRISIALGLLGCASAGPAQSQDAAPAWVRPARCDADRSGWLLRDVVLRGIVKTRHGYRALFEETDCRKTYAVEAHYKWFLDGEIVTIEAEGVTFRKTREGEMPLKRPKLLRLAVGGEVSEVPAR